MTVVVNFNFCYQVSDDARVANELAGFIKEFGQFSAPVAIGWIILWKGFIDYYSHESEISCPEWRKVGLA
jgi:hypothetical protein